LRWIGEALAEAQRARRGEMMEINEVTEKVIAAAIAVHRELGPGLLESVYHRCLCIELERMGVAFVSE